MPNDWYQVLINSILSFRVMSPIWEKYASIVNAGKIIIPLCSIISPMHNNQASEELQCMSKSPLENDNVCSKNYTFHDHTMTIHIYQYLYLYFDVSFPLKVHRKGNSAIETNKILAAKNPDIG